MDAGNRPLKMASLKDSDSQLQVVVSGLRYPGHVFRRSWYFHVGVNVWGIHVPVVLR